MKNTIPSDMWEKKKALIASLYKDEEWPLKQVIKKIRSEDFNPSETQLRSRLKKWRVTKPSRQTRKKSLEEGTGEDSGREESSPKRHSTNSSSPKSQTHSQQQPTDLAASEPEWYMPSSIYNQHPIPTAVSLGGQNVPSVWAPASSHPSPLSQSNKSRVNSYDPSHTSPLGDGTLLNPTPAMTPTFPDNPYSLAPDGCLQTPVSNAAAAGPIQWSMPQWYSMSMEASSRPPSVPFYTAAPLSPPIDPMIHMMGQQATQHVPEYHEGPRSWKRNLSVPYGPETGNNPMHVNQKGRQQPKPLERKASLPAKMTTSHPSVGVVTPTSPFFSHGQHPIMCSPGYHYPGPEHLIHRPPSIDF